MFSPVRCDPPLFLVLPVSDYSLRDGLLIFFLLVVPVLILITLLLLYNFRRGSLTACMKATKPGSNNNNRWVEMPVRALSSFIEFYCILYRLWSLLANYFDAAFPMIVFFMFPGHQMLVETIKQISVFRRILWPNPAGKPQQTW